MAVPASAVDVPPRVAFVTSASGSAVFGSWPEADPETTGLEAADSICQNLAADASLPDAEQFVAFISDSQDDAYCRLHNLGGKVEDNCEQGALPANAGPWQNALGTPFGASIDRLLSPHFEVYLPLDRDESGDPIPSGGFAWTATVEDGSVDGDTCEDWTAETTNRARVGLFDLTSGNWHDFGLRSCDQDSEDARLFCMQTLSGGALELPPKPTGQLAFVTSVTGSADFATWTDADPETSAIEAADSICNNRATAGGLPASGKYKAWLSTTESAVRDRLITNGPWFRPDGFEIASSLNDLTDGSIGAPINQDEFGNYLVNPVVFTGTSADGTGDGFDCGSWIDLDSSSREGRANTVSSFWTERSTVRCDFAVGRLYCFSDPPPNDVFADGFEEAVPSGIVQPD